MRDEPSVDSGIDDDQLLDLSELDPALAMPSPRVYRGSLIALLLGSVFAVWLLVLPPAGADRDQPPGSIGAIISGPVPTETATPTPTPSATATPRVISTPDPTASPEPTAKPEAPSEVTIYTVRSGDTMFAIAELFLPAGREWSEFVDEIAMANGISDPTQIHVGQVLEIPGQ